MKLPVDGGAAELGVAVGVADLLTCLTGVLNGREAEEDVGGVAVLFW